MGTTYLLHFDRPYKHAKHYLGHCGDLERRLQEHASGRGSKLCKAVAEAGIGWVVARTWPGDYDVESKLKRLKNAPAKLCPICRAQRENNG